MSALFPHIADLMNFSLEELVKAFKVSPKELRELATKIEKEEPENEKEKRDQEEKTFKEYYDRIMKSKKRKP